MCHSVSRSYVLRIAGESLSAECVPHRTPPASKEMNKLLSAIGRNINQIAKRVNAGGPTYQADMEEIRERLDQIWQLQRRILLSQR